MCVAEPAVSMSVVAGDSVCDEEEMLVARQKPAVYVCCGTGCTDVGCGR